MDGDTPVVGGTSAADLEAAYRCLAQPVAAFGRPDMEVLLRAGWTAGSYPVIEALSEHAIDAHTGFRETGGAGTCLSRLVEAAWDCTRVVGLAWAEAVPWLAVLAAAPTEEAVFAVQQTLRGTGPAPRGALGLAREWTDALGPMAALAFAAGLSLTEAQDRQAAGKLAETGLRTMAGLRGWRFPSTTSPTSPRRGEPGSRFA